MPQSPDISISPPNYNLLTNPHQKLSPRRSQLTLLKSPSDLHYSTVHDNTTLDVSPNDSPVHNTLQSNS